MKASLKFREEKRPLLRAKVPFSAAGVPLSSGIAVGSTDDLSAHIGTSFNVGPCVKLAFKPNDPWRPLSLSVKAGLGSWGSSSGEVSPLTMKAELSFGIPSSKGTASLQPKLGIRLKPRFGDVSIRKDMDNFDLRSLCPHKEALTMATIDASSSSSSESDTGRYVNIPSANNNNIYGSNGYGAALRRSSSSSLMEKNRAKSPPLESNAVVIGSNFSLKIEGLDKEWKNRKHKTDRLLKDSENVPPNSHCNTASDADLHVRNGVHKSAVRVPTTADSCIRGSRVVVHSRLPLGRQSNLDIRWGVKLPHEAFRGWDNSTPLLSLSRLPSLMLDKISFKQSSCLDISKPPKPWLKSLGYDDQNRFLPANFVQENKELAQVASKCYSMKQQLNFMYAENQVLKRAMHELTSAGFRGLIEFEDMQSGDPNRIQQKNCSNELHKDTNHKDSKDHNDKSGRETVANARIESRQESQRYQS